MKKLLFPVLLCISTLTIAQSEKSGFFKHIYTKLSPTLFIPVDGNLTPAAFGTIGVKSDKYVALGICGGYFKYNQEAKAVIPLGVELTVTNFKAKKIAPVFTAQIFKPTNYKKNLRDSWSKQYPNGSYVIYEDHTSTYETKGKSLFSVAAGATMPLGNHRLAFTAGYSQLAFKTLVDNSVHVYRSAHGSYTTYSNIRMVNVSLSFIF